MTCATARALDEFDGIKCGVDVPRALIGKRQMSQRVVAVEARHHDLALKDLGGTEISDHLFFESWTICGTEYELLVNTRTEVIRDVIPFPPHSAKSPESIGICQANGRDLPDSVVAVLDNRAGLSLRNASPRTLLKATAAWKIDESKEHFISLQAVGLSCPLESVVTADGGP
jgi:hypothetical protein